MGAKPIVAPAWIPYVFAAKTTAADLLALAVAFAFQYARGRKPSPFDAPRDPPFRGSRGAGNHDFIPEKQSDRNGAGIWSEAGRSGAGLEETHEGAFREQIKAAIKAELEEFSAHVRSEDPKGALRTFLEKRPPDFNRTTKSPAAA